MAGEEKSLAHFLRDHRERILSTWLERLVEMLSDPELTRAELRDHVPEFLRGLEQALAPGDTPDGVVARPGGAHGAQRFRVGFDVREVVSEYGLLLDVVLELAHAEGVSLSVSETRELFSAVNRGIAEAVAAFADERQQSEARQTGRHVAFISHELRNPLGGALLSLELVDKTELDEKQKRLAGLIRRNLNRLRNLIDQVLTAERLVSGTELVRERISIGALVDRIAEESALSALSRNVALTIDVDRDAEVIADARLLESILSNLLQNAIKFSSPGGQVELRARSDADRLLLEIEDSCGGLEIPAEEIFRPFVQGGNPDKQGFGLGLAIVRQAVEAHGGEIRIHNRPGVGCSFAIAIPGAAPPREAEPSGS